MDRERVFLALGGLGDLLLLTPLIRQVARGRPRGRVVCVCPPHAKELFDRNPHFDRLVVCPGPEIWYWALPHAGREVFAPFHKVELARAPGGGIRIVAEALGHAGGAVDHGRVALLEGGEPVAVLDRQQGLCPS